MRYGRSVNRGLGGLAFLLHPFMYGAEGDGDGAGAGTVTVPTTTPTTTPPPDPPKKSEKGEEEEEEEEGGAGDGKTFDKAYVEKLRKESADYRTKLRDAEKKLSDREKAEMDDLTRAQTERDEFKSKAETTEQELARVRMSMAISSAAGAANFHDPDDAISLLDIKEISVDDEGNPNKQSVEAAIKRLSASKPHLVKGQGGGSGDGGARGKGAGNLGDKTAEYQKHFSERGGVPIPK